MKTLLALALFSLLQADWNAISAGNVRADRYFQVVCSYTTHTTWAPPTREDPCVVYLRASYEVWGPLQYCFWERETLICAALPTFAVPKELRREQKR